MPLEITAVDALGYAAAAVVLATFGLREMVALRLMAIASNVLFVAYAHTTGLWPVLVLHTLLLPLNVLRLHQALRRKPTQVRRRRRMGRPCPRRASRPHGPMNAPTPTPTPTSAAPGSGLAT